MRLRKKKTRRNVWSKTAVFADVISPTRHPIILGGFGLDFRELDIQDCRIKGSTLGRTGIGSYQLKFKVVL